MTKADFIKLSEDTGYKSFKDLVEAMGYNRRTLDRYKEDKVLSSKFESKTLEFISKVKPTVEKKQQPPKEEKKVVKKEPAKKETIKKTENKKVEEHKHIEKVEQKETTAPKQVDKKSKDEIGIDIDNEVYHSSKKLGSSKVKLILENALEFKQRYITKEIGQTKTDALLIGSIHHTLVSEPQHFDRDYTVLEISSRAVKSELVDAVEKLGGVVETRENSKKEIVIADTIDTLKEKIEVLKQKSEKTIVTKAQVDIAKSTAEKALNSMFTIEVGMKTLLKAKLRDVLQLDTCYVEKTFYGVIDGVEMQVRPDILVNLSKESKLWFVIDLKTAEDATMKMFAQQSSKFFYDIQEYIYREILRQNGIIVKDFRFCVAGKKETSRSAYYQLHEEDIEDAGKMVSQILKKYKWCLENDIWEEGKFDYHRLRFEPTATIKLPTYRKFQMIDMGLM